MRSFIPTLVLTSLLQTNQVLSVPVGVPGLEKSAKIYHIDIETPDARPPVARPPMSRGKKVLLYGGVGLTDGSFLALLACLPFADCPIYAAHKGDHADVRDASKGKTPGSTDDSNIPPPSFVDTREGPLN